MSDTSTLETPILLLAMPQVLDPYFHKSVILLVRHEDEGSLGFIVNRPTELKIAEILEDLDVDWNGDNEAAAYFGGPVNPELGTLVFLERDQEDEDKVAGVSTPGDVDDLEALTDLPPGSFRLFLGYAGWGEGQLEEELLRNDWLIAPVQRGLIFNESPDSVWRTAFESMGINPDLLTTYNPDGSDVN